MKGWSRTILLLGVVVLGAADAFAQGAIGVERKALPLVPGVASGVSQEDFLNDDQRVIDRKSGEPLIQFEEIEYDQFQGIRSVSDPVRLGEVDAVEWRGMDFVIGARWYFCNLEDRCFAVIEESQSEKVQEVLSKMYLRKED